MRASTKARIRSRITFHDERAADLEQFANHWWRLSKYAWLAAAAVHRNSAHALAEILENERETAS